MLSWIKGLFTQYNLGDEVEFTVRVEIAMDGNCAWVRDPQYSQVMFGPFLRAGERFRVRGKVTGVGTFVHVSYKNYLPGHKPTNSLMGGTNSFCCVPWHLTKIN